MNRRQFLTSTSALGAAALLPHAHLAFAADQKKYRVGVIGTGWYGKCDLFRLIQVSPVDVVSICDVDKQMLAGAADMIAERQVSKKKPRTYGDFREMLKEKDLDIVIVGSPDHWHALHAIAAMEAEADVYCQKPISVDVAEGKAMVEAAAKLKRVVQIGTQRRSTPHLIEAKKEFLDSGRIGKVGLVEVYCYYHMRAKDNPPDEMPPENLDYELWTGPAPMRPYNKLVHPRRWRSFTEYGNGIVGDMCIHMLDCARWMLNLGWPSTVASTGGILVDKASKANISDTQTATWDFGGVPMVWTHRTWGTPPDPKYPWGLTIYGDKGTLKASVMSYDFIPQGKGDPVHKDVTYELEQFPEDKTEKDLEKHVAPAIRGQMKNFLSCIESRQKPVADITEGYTSTAACVLANISAQLGGRTLKVNADGKTGDTDADKLIKRPYRAPWKHPADV
ncbi:Gfo/Idh/MocA family oxidoreductase [Humisphaera borealis]|uniref:Gfo/Idh/MocA family oxidoreductase n=1 Tax=Humisphaera borealis TaxID=2807512 RepID=A0A7M2WXS1_9BACT|nr:Gfo/Idh/MocA family oxidoreductase [Humisphaera borealis]QOV90327.1 Gfo/Idh/MocA family oxidoreductase [Humisphaera borealis]